MRNAAAVTDLWNADLAPTTQEQRTWRWYHFAALWLGMVISVPAYMLAGGLSDAGMSPLQASLTVLLANAIVLIPILLVSHMGARYGVPYPVAARASFGTRGAALPALARAVVACGWFGIQTWIGGKTLLALASIVVGHNLDGPPIDVIGASAAELAAFGLFWLMELAFVSKQLTSIRRLETWTAPLKVAICIALAVWSIHAAHGLTGLFSRPSAFVPGGAKAGQFWTVFWPSLSAMIGFWATLALNVPDFSRYARSQGDQAIGQALGLPGPMGLLALVSVMTTSATVIVYGSAIWDPVALSMRWTGLPVLIGLFVISLDTVSCNIAANLVGPAFDFSSLWPKRISYRLGGYITAGLGVAIMPWKLLASTNGYIFTWLAGYSALLGPICGIMIADYWLLRRGRLDSAALFDPSGCYSYRRGWNPVALGAFALGVGLNVPGFLHVAVPNLVPAVSPIFSIIYAYAWEVGFLTALIAYTALTALTTAAILPSPVLSRQGRVEGNILETKKS